MTGKSKIQWTDVTWNPLAGCSIVSPGCTNCYAMRQAARIERMGGAPHYAGLTEMVKDKPVWTGKVAMTSEKTLLAPLRLKKPRKIFVNSMSDLFHEGVPDEWIDKIFAVMALAPQHTFQVLTKRSKRMRAYFEGNADQTRRSIVNNTCFGLSRWLGARFTDEQCRIRRWPLPNIWLGVTAEDQTRADERRENFKATPAAVKFVSYEPAIGPVDWSGWEFVDQIIFGGESGPDARPSHPQWARDTRDFCAPRGIAYFHKQWGEFVPCVTDDIGDRIACFEDGAKCDAFDDERKFPIVTAHGREFWRVGRRRAGCLLDGREHKDFPKQREAAK